MMDHRPPLTLLQGVRILSFTQFLLGPAGVQYLADMGADVIKIEAPGGRLYERTWSGCDLFLNGVSAFFLCANRNQRSLTLDLKQPEGQAIARRLVAEADVLVQNFRPGVAGRLGLDYEELAALNPRLIYVSASGYGEASPFRDRPGQDLLIQAMSGLASISGRGRRATHAHRLPDRGPARRGPAGDGGGRGALRPHQDRARAKDRGHHAARRARSANGGR